MRGFEFLGRHIDFDITVDNTAQRCDEAFDKYTHAMNTTAEGDVEKTVANTIDFASELFGYKEARKALGKSPSILDCLEFMDVLVEELSRQRELIEKYVERIK